MPVRHAAPEQGRTISAWPYPMYVESPNACEILSANPNNRPESGLQPLVDPRRVVVRVLHVTHLLLDFA